MKRLVRPSGAVTLLAGALLAACTSVPFSLHAVNVDGPTVEIMINGQAVATLACDSSTVLEPSASLPPLPWHVAVQTPAGTLLDNGRVSFGDGPPMGLIVRGTSVGTGPYPMSYGPSPGTSCPSPAPVPAGYDFVTHSLPTGPNNPTMTAAVEGTLARTGESVSGGHCLVVVEGSYNVTFVAWPEPFVLVLAGDATFEVHGAGKVLRQGEHVRLGGGYIDGSLVHHAIPGACQNSRYFAAETFP